MNELRTAPVVVVNPQQTPTQELLKGLNEVEQKYAPEVLYWAGDRRLLSRKPRIAVVGSRQVEQEDAERATRISRRVVDHGGVVVSGLALGVDGIAHRTAIAAAGRTIAVIGTTLERAYPREHADLQGEIADRHLLISQYAPGHPVQPKNFVLRNRTMALLSHATIIVAAGAKSGTEHQGWEAIRLGRIVLMPAHLAEADFDWPRKLAAYGAMFFGSDEELQDLLDEYLPGPAEAATDRGLPV